MNYDDSENFFVSDSLKDIIDQQSIVENSMEVMLKESGAVEVIGKFHSLSMKDKKMTLEVSPKVAKLLMFNDTANYAFSFMGKVWSLSSKEMSLEQCEKEKEKFKVTLEIEERK